MINVEVINRLIQIYADDKEMLDLIYSEIESFEDYHRAIYSMESKLRIYSSKVMERDDYQELVMSLDKKRTMQHNHVLTAVNVLNRMAAKEQLEPVYAGTVSEERPFRREVANAVLSYVEDVIKNRR